MGQIKSKPTETVFCSLCYYMMDKNTQTILEPCKHTLCKTCCNGYSYSMNYKIIFCPLCRDNYRQHPV